MRTKCLLGGLLVLFALSGVLPSVSAQTAESKPEAPPATPTEHLPEDGKRAREFMGDDLGQVLRLLARQAKISVAVGETVKGLVNMRLENISAMEAIEVMVRQYKLSMTRDEKGVYYINLPDTADTTLDFATRPETAYRIAAYKRNLYTALLKQGFTSEEALKIVVASDPVGTIAIPGKKRDSSSVQ